MNHDQAAQYCFATYRLYKYMYISRRLRRVTLTLKAPITTAADGKFCDIVPNLKKGMLFHENRLLADDSFS